MIEAAIAAYRELAERIIEQFRVGLVLPRRALGLAFACHLVIGGAGDRGEIVEIGPQRLAGTSPGSSSTTG